MLPNWLYGKSKSKLQEILGGGGGGGGGASYTAGDGIDISSGVISFDPETMETIPQSKVTNLGDNLADKVDWDVLSEVGAVNLLQNNATTQTINGVTFTVNSDGTIIANGANTSTSALVYEIDAPGDNFVLPAGSYKLTGCPSNGGDSTWRLQAYKIDGTTVVAIDNGNGAAFTLEEPTQLVVKIRIGGSIGSGTLRNLTFYPMITPVSYTGPYAPYAKTNKELTDDVAKKATIFGQKNWYHTASVGCDVYSGALAYFFTEAGIIKLSTAGGDINIKQVVDGFAGAHFNISGRGMAKDITCWSNDTFTTSRNTIWYLMPLVGKWTVNLS